MPRDSQTRILDVALEEFSENGFAGARVERIARVSKANKQLIYYYFTDKRGLYEAVCQRVFREIAEVGAAKSANLGDELVDWVDFHARRPYLIRLLEWEGKRRAGQRRKKDAQSRLLKEALRRLKSIEKKGLWPKAVSAEQILIANLAIVTWPLLFPTLCAEITGLAADSPKFLEDRKAFVRAFGKAFRET